MKKVLAVIFTVTILISGVSVSANQAYGPEEYNEQPLIMFQQGPKEYNGQPLKSVWKPEEYNNQELIHFKNK
jgi:hypothetical protein